MSPTCSSAPAGTFSRLPVTSESRTWTSSPRASSASATCDPMNPAPPVTIARNGDVTPGRFDTEIRCWRSAWPARVRILPAMFITFEGLDGSGKSTQVELLAEAIRETGREVVTTREPGGTPLGEQIREVILNGADASAWAEAALFAAARAELVERVIAPALERGAVVVCDRYLDSSLAYQGIARGLGIDRILQLNLPAIHDHLPDRTYLLLIDPEESERRVGD